MSRDAASHNLALAPGTVLNGQYEIQNVLGKPGGFGITYLAHDRALDHGVALKEFLPRAMIGRQADQLAVEILSSEDAEVFEYGLTRFLNEARMLARLDHPNIVRVRTFFRENGTAYIVMDYTPGRTLARHVERAGGIVDARFAVGIIVSVLDGLESAHAQQILHRDIKPENIYITQDLRPILLDFGAARMALGQRSQRLTTVLTPGFAPIEQYSGTQQGPWTDVYGCAAVLYKAITGSAPPDALSRIQTDRLVAPHQINAGLDSGLSAVIMRGLGVQPQQRPQTSAEFRHLLQQAAATAWHSTHSKTSAASTKVPHRAVKAGERLAWRRLAARTLDWLAYSAITLFVLAVLGLDIGAPRLLAVLMVPGWVPLEAALMTLTGTTPGKSLLGVRVETRSGEDIGFGVALKRAVLVWVHGLALQLPPLPLISLMVAYRRARAGTEMAWDQALSLRTVPEHSAQRART